MSDRTKGKTKFEYFEGINRIPKIVQLVRRIPECMDMESVIVSHGYDRETARIVTNAVKKCGRGNELIKWAISEGMDNE